jgi:hypothetical protein
VALTPHSPVRESSSKNAAMVLKNVKASQGNVCPVDISEKLIIYQVKPATYKYCPSAPTAPVFSPIS